MQILSLFKKENTPFGYAQFFNLFLSLYILSFGIENLIDISLFGNRVLVPEFIFLCLAFVFFSNKKNWSSLLSFNKLDLWILGYWISVLIGFLYSQKTNALGELVGNTYLVSLYFLLSKHFENHKLNINALLNTFVVSGVLASSIAIVGYIFKFPSFIYLHENYYFLGDITRLYGLMRGPIIFADYLSVVFLLGLGLLLFKKKKDKLLLIFLLIITLSIILSFSKSGLILAVAVVFLFQLRFKDKINPLFYFLLKSFSVIITVAYLFFSHFFIFQQTSELGQELASNKHSSCESINIPRTNLMLIPLPYSHTKRSAIIGFKRNFPFGVGGNELTNFNHQLYEQGVFNCDLSMAPHSTFFGALGELGIFGFISCSMIFFLVFSQIKKLKSINPKFYIIGMTIFLFIILQSMTTDMMNFRYLWILFFVVSFFGKNRN